MKKLSFLILIVTLAIAGAMFYFFRNNDSGPANLAAPKVGDSLAGDKTLTPVKVDPPVLGFLNIPEIVPPSSEFSIAWRATLPTATPFYYAALKYGPDSQIKEPFDYPKAALAHQGTTPFTFTDKIIAPASGKIYIRGNVLLNNVNYWTDEKVIQIKK